MTTILVATVNDTLDELAAAKRDADREHKRIHLRIDRRGDSHEALHERLFDSERGVLSTLAKKSDVSKLTVLLWGILVSVTTAAILLAVNLLVSKGGS